MDIRIPLLKRPVGAGDLVKAATAKAGVKPCGGCQKRAAGMNRALRFVPRKPVPMEAIEGDPLTPEGWAMLARCARAGLFRKPNGALVVCSIEGEQLRRCHTACCGNCECDPAMAQALYEERCQPR